VSEFTPERIEDADKVVVVVADVVVGVDPPTRGLANNGENPGGGADPPVPVPVPVPLPPLCNECDEGRSEADSKEDDNKFDEPSDERGDVEEVEERGDDAKELEGIDAEDVCPCCVFCGRGNKRDAKSWISISGSWRFKFGCAELLLLDEISFPAGGRDLRGSSGSSGRG